MRFAITFSSMKHVAVLFHLIARNLHHLKMENGLEVTLAFKSKWKFNVIKAMILLKRLQ